MQQPGPGYSDYYREIERREQSEGESKYFERISTSGTDLPYERNDQLFFVYSLSTKGIPPKAIDELHPSFRIAAAFPTSEEAREHAVVVAADNPQSSFFVGSCREWIVAPTTIERFQDQSVHEEIKTSILEEYMKVRARNDKEFENVRKDSEFERSVDETRIEEVDDVPIVTVASKSHMLKGRHELADQQFAAVVVLPGSKGEFVFQMLACFPTEDEADRWIVNVASRKITAYDIHLISCCKWLFAHRLKGDGAMKDRYRTKELEKIMERRRDAPREVRDYEEHLAEQEESNLPALADISE
jgi:hypothetical protein